ncbi:nickel pincer cofactor biosynthesis protein LarC [Porcincola sp. LCP21S3_C12]|uniref:nickel pincer cofactor biosynthesis protein LarC n=1 Tax=Porcincola sp. LCP21S3_C12 TaxID=3438798 RepID=UPI003F97D4DE
MKVLYLDLGMGAAGDMLSAALFELLSGKEQEDYLSAMNHLGLDGVSVQAERSEKCGITGTHMAVLVDGSEEADIPAHVRDGQGRHEHGHIQTEPHPYSFACAHNTEHVHDHVPDHDHAHHHHALAEIHEAIWNLNLPDTVKTDAQQVYRLLAEAESHAHGVEVEQIHFHEVGEKDAIADIVSVCLLMRMIRPDKVIASPAATGTGTVRCAHGLLPVPAPATAYILKKMQIPCLAGTEDGELLTPTGAALTGFFADAFGTMPEMTLDGIGYGMGKKDFSRANCVRALLGQTASEEDKLDGARDEISELSCNLDDMTPEDLSFAVDRLFEAGALDVFTTPAGMKKSRPGVILSALCHREQKASVIKAFFAYTTTLGIREKICQRYIMKSGFETVTLSEADFGRPVHEGSQRSTVIPVKKSEGYGAVRLKPEYDPIAAAAKQFGLPVAEIRRKALERCGEPDKTILKGVSSCQKNH